jgi:hypothetical protein
MYGCMRSGPDPTPAPWHPRRRPQVTWKREEEAEADDEEEEGPKTRANASEISRTAPGFCEGGAASKSYKRVCDRA